MLMYEELIYPITDLNSLYFNLSHNNLNISDRQIAVMLQKKLHEAFEVKGYIHTFPLC